MNKNLFTTLQGIATKPMPYSAYSSFAMYNDPYVSNKFLELHLNPSIDLLSKVSTTIAQEIEWINRRFKVDTTTRICDFGCGPGLYTSQWAKAGAKATGLDISERSILYAQQYAKQKNLDVEYICQDFLTYVSAKKFNIITMIFSIFCEFNHEQRACLLERFYNLLEDDGMVLLDVFSINHFKEMEEKEATFEASFDGNFWGNFWSDKPYYLFKSCFKYDEEYLTLDKYTIVDAEQTREIYLWKQYFDLISLNTEFKENGFEIIESYSDLSGKTFQPNSPTIAIIAKKLQ